MYNEKVSLGVFWMGTILSRALGMVQDSDLDGIYIKGKGKDDDRLEYKTFLTQLKWTMYLSNGKLKPFSMMNLWEVKNETTLLNCNTIFDNFVYINELN